MDLEDSSKFLVWGMSLVAGEVQGVRFRGQSGEKMTQPLL